MIVITRKIGRLGNQLLLNAHLIAAAEEYGVSVWNPVFGRYGRYFESTASDRWCRFPPTSVDSSKCETDVTIKPHQRGRRLMERSLDVTVRAMAILPFIPFPVQAIRLVGQQTCDLASDHFRRLASSRRPLLISGWRFRSDQLVNKHIGTIRDHFQIAPQHRRRVQEVIGEARAGTDFLVGVHIRHGDYARWKGGRYYFPIVEYVTTMYRIRERLAGRSVAFFVSSDTRLKRSDFGDLEVHFGTRHEVEDLYGLAETDFLIGPPSTYSGWASLYGDVPLERLRRSHRPLRLHGLLKPIPVREADRGGAPAAMQHGSVDETRTAAASTTREEKGSEVNSAKHSMGRSGY